MFCGRLVSNNHLSRLHSRIRFCEGGRLLVDLELRTFFRAAFGMILGQEESWGTGAGGTMPSPMDKYESYAEHCLKSVKLVPDRESRVLLREMAAELLKLAGRDAPTAATVRQRRQVQTRTKVDERVASAFVTILTCGTITELNGCLASPAAH